MYGLTPESPFISGCSYSLVDVYKKVLLQLSDRALVICMEIATSKPVQKRVKEEEMHSSAWSDSLAAYAQYVKIHFHTRSK